MSPLLLTCHSEIHERKMETQSEVRKVVSSGKNLPKITSQDTPVSEDLLPPKKPSILEKCQEEGIWECTAESTPISLHHYYDKPSFFSRGIVCKFPDYPHFKFTVLIEWVEEGIGLRVIHDHEERAYFFWEEEEISCEDLLELRDEIKAESASSLWENIDKVESLLINEFEFEKNNDENCYVWSAEDIEDSADTAYEIFEEIICIDLEAMELTIEAEGEVVIEEFQKIEDLVPLLEEALDIEER